MDKAYFAKGVKQEIIDLINKKNLLLSCHIIKKLTWC